MMRKRAIIICFIFTLLQGKTISNLLDKKISETTPYTFLPVWVLWDSAQNASDIFTIELIGGRLRTNSFLLNASSFYIPAYQIKNLETFKNVKSLDIVRIGRIEGDEKITRTKQFYLENLNYGHSRPQLEAINIPPVHDKGYLGSGVKIAVFDTGFDSTHISINHIWQRGGIIAKHDFNSGDRIESSAGNPPLPYPGVKYINSFSVAKYGDTLSVVYSIAPEESLAGNYVRNRWGLFYSYGIITNGGINWALDTKKVFPSDSFVIQPHHIMYGDSIYVVWQKALPSNNFDVYFGKGLVGEEIGSSVNLSSDVNPSLNPEILFTGNKILVIWADTATGIHMRASTDMGNSFSEDTLIFEKFGRFCGLSSLNRGESLFITVSYNDSIFVIENNGLIWQNYFLHRGTLPSITYLDGKVHIVFLRQSYIYYTSLQDIVGDIVLLADSVYPTPPKIFEDDGKLILYYTSKNGELIKGEITSTGLQNEETVAEIFSDLPNGTEGIYFWRRRGDDNVFIDDYAPHVWFSDRRYHGTKVLSVIAGFYPGNLIGPAPAADFILAKTERPQTRSGVNFENQLEEDFWVEALEWAITKGAKIVSSSLGYIDWYDKEDIDGSTPVSSRAASLALQKGTIVVTAMGNEPWNRASFPDPLEGDTTLVAPADADSVVAVGAYSIDSLGNFLPRGGYGPTHDGRVKPEVIAPSELVVTAIDTLFYGDTVPEYIGLGSGTSYGTALVAGLIATVWEAHPSWDASKMREVLLSTSRKVEIPGYLGAPIPNNITGYGLPDAYEALYYEEPEVLPAPGDILLDPYPNPFKVDEHDFLNIVFNLSHRTFVTLRIYTVSGEKIFEVTLDQYEAGIGRRKYKWDGRTSKGKKISPGLYIISMKTGFGTSIVKFAAVR